MEDALGVKNVEYAKKRRGDLTRVKETLYLHRKGFGGQTIPCHKNILLLIGHFIREAPRKYLVE